MSGGSMGVSGVNRVAKERLDANNPFRPGPGGMPPRGGFYGVFEVPPSFIGKVLLGAALASYGCYWLNRRMYTTTPDSMTPDFQEKARRHGPVAERSGAPPVFLNPIMNRIPGYIRGPDDVASA